MQTARCCDLNNFRIMVMGDQSTGKTSLIMRWINNAHSVIPNDELTLDNIYSKYFSPATIAKGYDSYINKGSASNKSPSFIHGRSDAHFLDISGRDVSDYQYSELRNLQIKQADAFVLCFDLTNRRTFETLQILLTVLKQTLREQNSENPDRLTKNIPIIICATKSDLLAGREIFNDEIGIFLQESGLNIETDYFEVSTIDDLNTSNILYTTMFRIEQNKKYLRKITKLPRKKRLVTKSVIKEEPATIENQLQRRCTTNSEQILLSCVVSTPTVDSLVPVKSSIELSCSNQTAESTAESASTTVTNTTNQKKLKTQKNNKKIKQFSCVIA